METQGKPRVQEYPGLDAGGFLMIALAHLMKAHEKLEEPPKTSRRYGAKSFTIQATQCVRHALDLLDKLKEDTCEKS